MTNDIHITGGSEEGRRVAKLIFDAFEPDDSPWPPPGGVEITPGIYKMPDGDIAMKFISHSIP